MILDTDFLIALLRKDKEALQFLESLVQQDIDLWITHVNLWELYQGVFNSQRISENLADVEELISYFGLLGFTKESDKRFGMLISERRIKEKPIGVMDTILASLALEFNKTLITRNTKHFEVTGVSIKEW